MMMELSAELLAEYQEAYRVPPRLLRELIQRDAQPAWANFVIEARRDWLSSLHQAVTEKDWPERLRDASAGVLDYGNNLCMTEIGDKAGTILMPISTPGYLRTLLELMAYPLIPPDSVDPNATMSLDGQKMDEAARRLELLLGMLAETGYLDSHAPDNAWGGAVTAGARFLYYHELGHMSRAAIDGIEAPDWLVPGEEELVEELVADQFALSMLSLELRHHSDLQPVGFSGVALALGFVALKEFAEIEYEGGKRKFKNAMLRMSRLLHWGRLTVELGALSQESIVNGELIWNITRGLLARVQKVPSPVSSLLIQTTKQPFSEWRTASNHLLQWCAYGDREKALSTVRNIRDNALRQANESLQAQKILEVIEFLLRDTACIEPTLGLRAALEH